MHHHHLPTAATTTPTTSGGAHVHAHQRRRKKRPNYGTRTVEVRRGYNGFGFTISGQQPCRLSCIVTNSPADQAGLRAGDFLISVNGLNVSKLPHETVVQLIGNSFGSIRMQIAENYYSDSSDEENAALMLQQQQQSAAAVGSIGASSGQMGLAGGGVRAKPRYLHHKAKMNRLRNSPQKKRTVQRPDANNCMAVQSVELQTLRPLMEDLPLSLQSTITSSSISCKPAGVPNNMSKAPHVSSDVANVSAMVRVPTAALEYRAIVGYLGTIEMPKQISHSSKLQTVRSCIRKLRQEKRQPTTVLMTILPDCLRLQAASGSVLASYASERLNYVSSSSESENRFFGLVTSAVHTSQLDEEDEDEETGEKRDMAMVSCSGTGHISISNSCHVFVIDTKLCEHQAHLPRAAEFRILCTRDPISSLCLEFPNNSEYVVNLIRSMYTMRILPPATRHVTDDFANGGAHAGPAIGAAAHSPQPSNHSEISTTTSNSDSGIGFHNDCTNISDRILVVDFPGQAPTLRMRPCGASMRPVGIFNNFDAAIACTDKRLTVRAMPDPKTPSPSAAHLRPNLLANFNLIKSPASSLTATRSCDNVLALVERSTEDTGSGAQQHLLAHASMDDISLHSAAAEEHSFLHPSCVAGMLPPANRKCSIPAEAYSLMQDCHTGMRETRHSLQAPVPSKLSAQVFGHGNFPSTQPKIIKPPAITTTRQSFGFQEIEAATNTAVASASPSAVFSFDLDTWSSLQDLHATVMHGHPQATTSHLLEATNSEPDLGNRALPANASPFRRAWGQSSFRTPRTDNHHHQSPLVRRTASMTASDNDVYVKSMDGYIDELKQTHSSQQQISGISAATKSKQSGTMPGRTVTIASSAVVKAPQIITEAEVLVAGPPGVLAWGSSFERLLEDPAGLHTFAEFLKKEFSAENIYFWTACERFRHMESEAERATQALDIYSKHLANGALEPVNVDSQARNLTMDKLQSAERDIFAHAQKQIFNLMKFDSYQRFIRSDLYKSCLEAEDKHQALPYGADDLDELLKTNFQQGASKLKKSASNAEDRRRKSLLPWHRKTRSKSRDGEGEAAKAGMHESSKLPQLSGSSLKIPSTHNSISDVHSSRSSLSSFDALPGGVMATHASNGQASVEATCSLCRVILSDGATTIVQTRSGETVGQLVERLLEKRGLTYQFYDVVANGSTKSIDLQSPAQIIAGKEVLIEQRVAFKLDLPDPKVISVKSKPKKQLHEVIRPILHKYNYSMEAVQVLMRDTHAQLDLSLPVTVADGQRLQIVLIKPTSAVNDYQNGCATSSKFAKPALPKSVTFPCSLRQPTTAAAGLAAMRNGVVAGIVNTPQSTLDEITNKVFNELLQGKVEAHAAVDKQLNANELLSLKSDDCASETSSIFDRMRRRDSSTAGLKLKSKKKSTSSQHSEETNQSIVSTATTTTSTHPSIPDIKKPIIAKLKAGVKLQVTERVAENQDELLEGLKRAQLARLEDQRGTEINFELPDFLKNKENLSAAASKLRKVRANLSPVSKSSTAAALADEPPSPQGGERPQPAPRLSITNKNKSSSVSPMKIDEEPSSPSSEYQAPANTSGSSLESDYAAGCKGPPPLPPKPKVLPIKPSNWGACSATTVGNSKSATSTSSASAGGSQQQLLPSKIPIDIGRKTHLSVNDQAPTRCAYLEEPSSSFV